MTDLMSPAPTDKETEPVVPKPGFDVPRVHTKIVEAMSRLRKIEKKRETTGGERFSYRGIEDAMRALQPVLIELGLHINQEVISVTYDVKESQKGNAMTVCFMQMRFQLFCTEDGSSIFSSVASEGVDVSDKASNKALSNCLKYWIFQLFCIPTSEMKDSEGDAHPEGGFKPGQKGKPRNEAPPPKTPPPPPPATPAPAPAPYLFKVPESGEQLTVNGKYANSINSLTTIQGAQQAFAEAMLRAGEEGVPEDHVFPWDTTWDLDRSKLACLILRARTEAHYRAKKAAGGA